MKKLILAFTLFALLLAGQLVASADEPSAVTAVDGNITISAAVDAADNTPVLIFILPAVLDSDERDITAESVQQISAADALDTLKVEYTALAYVTSGRVEHSCVMKDSLATGVCHVILSHLDAESCYSAGTFEHVGGTDKKELLDAFNAADKDTCGAVIDEDMKGKPDTDGVTLLEPKEILRKSSADVAYYDTLNEDVKAQFHELLYQLKGEESFDLPLLVDCFNKAGVWTRLRQEADTLGVLSAYNGEGIGKYWNIAIGEGSDYASLPGNERNAILTAIKSKVYLDEADLETDFHEAVILASFRCATTREELAELIDAEGPYGADFSGVRNIIEAADLDEYNEALMYNNVLSGNKSCADMEAIEALFKASVPEVPAKSDGGTKGGSGSRVSTTGGAATYKASEVLSAPAGLPFVDVTESHWAYSYVKRLYESGTVNGISAAEFAPHLSVTRQDFVKLFVGALGMEAVVSEIPFYDVEEDSYYAPFVMTAYQNGLIAGVDNDYFGVGLSIKREDAAVIMDRALTKYGIETGSGGTAFSDEAAISDYAKASVERMAAAGIFGGDENGSFNPKDNLSRAEACAILCRLAEII